MAKRTQHKKKIDTVEKLAGLLVESLEDLRSDMNKRFDGIGDQLSAVQERMTAVESKIAGSKYISADDQVAYLISKTVRLAEYLTIGLEAIGRSD